MFPLHLHEEDPGAGHLGLDQPAVAIEQSPGLQHLLQNRPSGFRIAEGLIADGDDDAIEAEFPLPFRDGILVVNYREVQVMHGEVDAEAGELQGILGIRLGRVPCGCGFRRVRMEDLNLIPAESTQGYP
jgi:hypothetical protein